IGGPPGSGKTTVAERFAQAHAYALVSAGLKFRQMAKDRAMDLDSFSKAAEADPDIDRSLDRAVLEEILRLDSLGRDVIVDGRIQAHLLTLRRVPCLKVMIDAALKVRAERVSGRERQDARAAEREIAAREASERSRYKRLYGIDLADRSVYDLVIDSSDKTPDAIVAIVWSRVEG
ncbi:MAG TPA: cytidylate kinase family protein, partial [Thermoplasmata archaeon]|nr:cytidylate kinase family protein [Thermoplasmata archaeon]